nr:hypothetical protein [Pseudovibrio denitrificans]
MVLDGGKIFVATAYRNVYALDKAATSSGPRRWKPRFVVLQQRLTAKSLS